MARRVCAWGRCGTPSEKVLVGCYDERRGLRDQCRVAHRITGAKAVSRVCRCYRSSPWPHSGNQTASRVDGGNEWCAGAECYGADWSDDYPGAIQASEFSEN